MKISPSYLRFYVTVLASLLVFSLRDTFAQSLGDLARQERARKLARQSHVTRVFTNEDLQREVIITPEERAAMEQAAGQEQAELADNGPQQTPSQPVPVHLTFVPQAMPGKEIAATAAASSERAVPTVPIWSTGIPLGDIARYYRQQVAPVIPTTDDSALAAALANAPLPRDFSQDRLQMTLVPGAQPVAAIQPQPRKPRQAAADTHLPAPFVLAYVEGSTVPVIENVREESVPEYPSPAVNFAMASAAPAENARPRPEGLRFEAPDMSEVVLSFGADASLDIPTLGGSNFSAPMYDSSRDPITIRFAAPQPAPAPAARRVPVAHTAEPVAGPTLRATITSTSSLETVSPWRYVDEMPAAPPAAAQAAADRIVVASTADEPAGEPEVPAAREVRVERGDSLWKLAERHLGNGNAWTQIAEANPQLANPNHIVAGQRLHLPGTAVAATPVRMTAPAVAVDAGASKSVTVRKGDSLWKLAETALGNGAAWSCIASANPQITNADRILAGQTLVLPSSCNPQS